ncbi:hypothetical protein [Hyphobacterium sp.]
MRLKTLITLVFISLSAASVIACASVPEDQTATTQRDGNEPPEFY